VTFAIFSRAARTITDLGDLHFAIGILQFAIAAQVFGQDATSFAAREEAALQAAADRVAPSVVQIRTIGGLDVVDGQVLNDGPTTGLVISADGYILSSAFNFAQQPSSVLVTFASGKQAPAELIATDHSRMTVLLKAAGMADLPVPEMAPAAEVRPGQWAVALGRTFRPDRPNVTVGIVSATGRMYGKAIQTDADVSTANYGGPLVDIRGRVLGIIVPMAPRATREVAGAEWYDSGIGFAVPLEPLTKPIERMKTGEDLRAGLLGVGMKAGNPHTSPAEVAVVRPDSPAGQAGLKKGDRLVEIDKKAIRNQSDMRFALGTAYGGDVVRIVAKRGDERLERTIELVGKLPPFRHAFLGILPLRPATEQANSDAPGVAVRMVYAGSPAADAGIEAGDRILMMDDAKIESIDDAIVTLNNIAPEGKVKIHLSRGGETKDMELTAARLPSSVPGDLPPASGPVAGDEDAVVGAGETIELKLPEFPHTCHVYVPGSHAAGQSLGTLLWLPAPGESKADDVISQWQANCEREGFALIVPMPDKSDHWERTDLEYLQRVLQRVVAQYKIDPRRVVVGGRGRTGAIVWPLALASRDLVRGIAAVAAPLPRGNRVPENDPTQRLAIFAAIPPSKDVAAPILLDLKRVTEGGYNVTTITAIAPTGELSDAERNELARWIDTLDRF
jgi:serine protease Do